MPGGVAMVATIPADIAQYFAYMMRVMQKLAYLYGFEDFELNKNTISDDTMNQIMIFLGVMFGVQGANAGVKKIAEATAKKYQNHWLKKHLPMELFTLLSKKLLKQLELG